MFLEGVEQVLVMALPNVLYPEVVKNKAKNNWAAFVAPESWSFGGSIITVFVQTDAENIIRQFSGLQ